MHYARTLEKYEITLLDIDESKFEKMEFQSPSVKTIVANGCNMPFGNCSFDIVISADSAEHVPKQLRGNYFNELKRVARSKMMVHCPVESQEGEFRGRQSDIEFQEQYVKSKGRKETNTADHIRAGHPTLKELQESFPEAHMQGVQNTTIWLKYMLFSRRPILGFCSGLLYWLNWQRKGQKPPFHGAFLLWDKVIKEAHG